jgi:uncharacterized protein YjaZ
MIINKVKSSPKLNTSKNKMLKKLVILASLVLFSSIVLGQAIKPHRIVYNGDTGIFFNKQQEIILLGIIKTERAQKKEMEQLYIYMDNCDDQLKAEQEANVYINKLFTEMESEANRLKDKYNNELIEHAKTKEQLKIQKDRKKKWRGLAIGSGIVNVVLIYLISK